MKHKHIEISEKDFRQQVVDLARVFGWKVYWTWRSVHSPAGFPDLCLVREKDKRLIFAELKSETGQLTPEQKEWLAALEATGKAEVYLWHPSDFEALAQVLA